MERKVSDASTSSGSPHIHGAVNTLLMNEGTSVPRDSRGAAGSGAGAGAPAAPMTHGSKSRRSKAHQEWCCQVCGNMNYGHRSKCHMSVCGAVKGFPGPYKMCPTGPKNKFNHQVARVKKLNWNCPRCGNENRSIRDQCHTKNCAIERIWSQNGEMSFREFKGTGPSSQAAAPLALAMAPAPHMQPPAQMMMQVPGSLNTSHGSIHGQIIQQGGGGMHHQPQLLGSMSSVSSSALDSSQSTNFNMALNSISQLGMLSLGQPLHPEAGQVSPTIQSSAATGINPPALVPVSMAAGGSSSSTPQTPKASGEQVFHLTAADLGRLTAQCQQQAMLQLQQQSAPPQQQQQLMQPMMTNQQHPRVMQIPMINAPQFTTSSSSMPMQPHQPGSYVDPLNGGQHSMLPSGLLHPPQQPQQPQLSHASMVPHGNSQLGASASAPPEGALFQVTIPPNLQSSSHHPMQPIPDQGQQSVSYATTAMLSSHSMSNSHGARGFTPTNAMLPPNSQFTQAPKQQQQQPGLAASISADGSLFSIYPPGGTN